MVIGAVSFIMPSHLNIPVIQGRLSLSHERVSTRVSFKVIFDLVHIGRIPTGNARNRHSISPEKQVLAILWSI